MAPAIAVRPITAREHLAFVGRQPSVSFLQTPAWAAVKTEWRSESVGWFDGGRQTGAGIVLYRQLPVLRRSLAYLPEGPSIDWSADDLVPWLEPLLRHVRGHGAFAVRLGPPVATRVWEASTVKQALSDPAVTRLADVPADEEDARGARVRTALRELGWRPVAADGGFGTGQPRYVFQLPLAGRSEQELLAGMNQSWRRNIRRSAKEGVSVSVGTDDDLAGFHLLYSETAAREGFTPRPAAYFRTMYSALSAEAPDRIRLYLARHDGDLLAATLWIKVGAHVWYAYGGSTTSKRELRASNAVQWRMIQDALAADASVYDLRGITDTLSADDPLHGLTRFKVGTGGRAVEYVGEWTLPLSRTLAAAFDIYVRRRSVG